MYYYFVQRARLMRSDGMAWSETEWHAGISHSRCSAMSQGDERNGGGQPRAFRKRSEAILRNIHE